MAVDIYNFEMNENDYIDEQDIGLTQYLKVIDKNVQRREDSQIGQKIWNYLKKEIDKKY